MKTDNELQCEVAEWLSQQPDLRVDQLNVQVDGGVVTLSGTLRSELQREEVEDGIRRLPGPRALNNLTTFRPDSQAPDANPDIAQPWFSPK